MLREDWKIISIIPLFGATYTTSRPTTASKDLCLFDVCANTLSNVCMFRKTSKQCSDEMVCFVYLFWPMCTTSVPSNSTYTDISTDDYSSLKIGDN